MITPTQAQIAHVIFNRIANGEDVSEQQRNELLEFLGLAAAAEVGEKPEFGFGPPETAEAGKQGGYGLKKGDPRLDEIVGGPRKPKLDSATITQAQIEALRKAQVLSWDGTLITGSTEKVIAALTAAAEAGAEKHPYDKYTHPPLSERVRNWNYEDTAATIERCAQRLDEKARATKTNMRVAYENAAAAIRALKDQP